MKEKRFDKLRYYNIKMKHIKIKDTRVRKNKMFQEDQGMFYRKKQETKELKERVLKMEKLEEFQPGIREDNTETPHQKWVNTVAKKIGQKVEDVQEFTKKKLHQTVKNRRNWSVPWINRVQNLWWETFRGTWSAILRCFNQWLGQPDKTLDWLTQGQTVLLPMSEVLSNKRNYCPNTCRNTCLYLWA